MNSYHPDYPPNPLSWLALSEEDRISLCESYHRQTKTRLPRIKAHALFHAVVENQVAEGLDSVVRAMARLQAEGLTRHDAVHAVASVLTEYLVEATDSHMIERTVSLQTAYDLALERLDCKSWHDLAR